MEDSDSGFSWDGAETDCKETTRERPEPEAASAEGWAGVRRRVETAKGPLFAEALLVERPDLRDWPRTAGKSGDWVNWGFAIKLPNDDPSLPSSLDDGDPGGDALAAGGGLRDVDGWAEQCCRKPSISAAKRERAAGSPAILATKDCTRPVGWTEVGERSAWDGPLIGLFEVVAGAGRADTFF